MSQNINFTLFHFKYEKAILLQFMNTCAIHIKRKTALKAVPSTALCELTYEINTGKILEEKRASEVKEQNSTEESLHSCIFQISF